MITTNVNGFEPGELEGKVGPVPAHGNAAGGIPTAREALVATPLPKRPLQRLGLDEELYQLEKRKKSLDLFQQVANSEALSHTTAENPRQRANVRKARRT